MRLFDSVTLTPHHHTASSLAPILITLAVRGRRLTINNSMGHTKLLAQITYMPFREDKLAGQQVL